MATNMQKRLLLGEGFLGGLAALGVESIPANNMAFELPFMAAWRQWIPMQNAKLLPSIDYGGLEEPRMFLFRIERSRSPFKNFHQEGITPTPFGLTPREFLEIWCSDIPVSNWIDLADSFVRELND